MDSNQTSGALNVAVAAALDAGKLIQQGIDRLDRVKVTQKSPSELVSEIDIQVEQLIIEQLASAYPEIGVLAEESGHSPRDGELCWVIDPLDGTHNFLHGLPHCCTSIALQQMVKGQAPGNVLVAVVYDPFRNELFSARKGQGAQLDGRRIRVSDTSKLTDSLLCTGYPGRHSAHSKAWLKSFAAALPRARSVHRNGSSILDLAWLASGRYDACFAYGLQHWDLAAGALLVREAGGLISDLGGNDNLFDSGNIVAGNPKVYEKLNHLLTGARV
ncbi:MAG: inositol monophosphatase [Gammaproteobacteria bacterium]|nr:inositol monophosphatase [Gammaproteobacteria bacterium]